MAAKTRTRGMTAMAMARMGSMANGQGKNNRNCANWPQKLQVTKVKNDRYVLAAEEPELKQPSNRVVGAGQMR
jgi:hypothetical protein